MATNFPTGLDSLTNPTSTDTLASPSHSAQHANSNDAIEALQAKVGVTNSAVTTSLDYLVRNINASTAIISGSSAGDLVRITQTGAGNALIVEDSANPDSTPFVITGSGTVGIGSTPQAGRTLTVDQPITGSTLGIGVFAAGTIQSDVTSNASLFRTFGATQNAVFTLPSFRHFFATQGTFGASSTVTEQIGFLADASLIGAGTNIGFYGNIPSGTNRWNLFMNGTANNYLVGSLGIGNTSLTGRRLVVGGNLTGAVASVGLSVLPTIQSDVTTSAYLVNTVGVTTASAFTLDSLHHFRADQQAFGAGSTVNTQYGFIVGATLVGATTNYGFYSNIPVGTGRWNLYMAGTADNYMAGRLGIGAITTSGTMMRVTNTTAADIALTVKGAASQSGLLLDIENSAGTTLSAFDSSGRLIVGSSSVIAFGLATPSAQVLGTTASASAILQGRYSADANPPTLYFAKSRNATVGSHTIVQSGDSLGRINFGGSDGTDFSNTAAIYVEAEGTLAAGVVQSRFVFQNQTSAGVLTERMRIDSSGQVGFGSTPAAGFSLVAGKNITGATTSRGITSSGNIQSDVTNTASYFASSASTAATAFTVGTVQHFTASQGTFGAGSTVSTQIGFSAQSSLTGATNNYAFHSDIAAGTGRFNLYMGGTADNYLAGRLGIGTTLVSGAMALVANTAAADKVFVVRGAASQSNNLFEAQNSSSTALVIIDSAGKVGIGNTAPENTLDVTGSFGRGNPAVKTANFTLAGTENWIICNGTGSITVTLPTPSTCDGREFGIKTVAPQTVVSASSNVIAIGGGAAGTAILPATSGAWAILVSDGSNWNIMCRGT